MRELIEPLAISAKNKKRIHRRLVIFTYTMQSYKNIRAFLKFQLLFLDKGFMRLIKKLR